MTDTASADAKLDRIVSDPAIMDGQPCIRGTRLTVHRVLMILAQCPDREAIRAGYPQLDDESIRQAPAYAAANLDQRIVPPPQAS